MENEQAGSSLRSRKAVVSGGAGGIGLALAERLAAEGAGTVAVDIDPAGGGDLARRGVDLVVADVANPADWKRVTEVVNSRLGGLDLLVLNAGVPVFDPDVIGAPYERVRRAYDVNVEGVIHGLRAGVPLMEATGGGDVVIVASLAGVMAYPDDPYYAMTKHAVVGLGLSAARSLQARGVRVTIFCPGVVDTKLVPAHVRVAVSEAGLEPLSPAEAAGHLLAALDHGGTGRIWLSQAQLGLVEYVPARVPLPRPARTGRA
ncbi:SDR family oxidoreductase [Mycolicibacterium pulveris]|uniref:Short chain dehydrogenase n=1 Tax=Mycolicibacterium pulveris TaxID=36813 RepID=A0A7I7USP6_MYCPV|nr:SDR family oxidoreductase [Mycolicibacterium pulveris]MCV6983225.1 SDR family oxidoreductase [Mycolicibacterium pulveris]BBY83096.1 short chain dehydrogenase [Mycolicibacterium pulveris]